MLKIFASKIVIDHLRVAIQRFEQFPILSLLVLYIECASIDEVRQLKENDNVHIVERIVQLMSKPTIYVSSVIYDFDPATDFHLQLFFSVCVCTAST